MHAPARHRILGAAMAVTAAVSVAAAPVAPVRARVPRSVPVALTGLDGPVYQALLSARVVNNDLFNGVDVFGDYPWQPFQGLVPEAMYTALPVLTQMGFNGRSAASVRKLR